MTEKIRQFRIRALFGTRAPLDVNEEEAHELLALLAFTLGHRPLDDRPVAADGVFLTIDRTTISVREAEPATPAPRTPSPAPAPDPPPGMAGRAVLAGPAAEFPESTADVLKRIQGKHYRLGSKPADRQALWNRYIGLKVTSKTATLAALRALEAALDGELKQRRLA